MELVRRRGLRRISAGPHSEAVMNRPELVSLPYEGILNPDVCGRRARSLVPIDHRRRSRVASFRCMPSNTTGLDNRYEQLASMSTFPLQLALVRRPPADEAMAHFGATTDSSQRVGQSCSRDVNQAWNNANSGYQSLSEVQQLVNQATEALSWLRRVINLGLSSIVELPNRN